MRNKMLEFKVSTFTAAIATYKTYLRPDTISLVNNIRDRNFRERSHDPFVLKDTLQKASIANAAGTAVLEEEKFVTRLHNCTRPNGSPGLHMTKSCTTSPCKVCLALGRLSDHQPVTCSGAHGARKRFRQSVMYSMPQFRRSPAPSPTRKVRTPRGALQKLLLMTIIGMRTNTGTNTGDALLRIKRTPSPMWKVTTMADRTIFFPL